MANEQSTYALREVSEELGVDEHVLRYWETEFEALQPPKDEGGQRCYRAEDVATARRIQQLLKDEKYTIAGARQALQRDETRQQAAERLRDLRAFLVALRDEVRSAS
jgi:DNA-binding transcriptional MerR regulator